MIALWLALSQGCKSSPADSADTGLCADAPTLSYENFGASFFTQECQSCHASTSPNRQGAPESVTFDTEKQVMALADRILERAAGNPPTMPPEGGVSDDDLAKLRIWLSCD